MVNVIQAVVTEDALKLWPQMFINLKTFMPILFFKIGEGGWIDEGSGPVPRAPDPTLRKLIAPYVQDLDAVVDVNRTLKRYPTSPVPYTFPKNFISADFSFATPSSLQCRCFLNNAEGNGPGPGPANYYEIGLFTDHPDYPGVQDLMVAYGTFPLEAKTSARQLDSIVVVHFSGT